MASRQFHLLDDARRAVADSVPTVPPATLTPVFVALRIGLHVVIVGLAIAAGWVNVNLFLALALLFIAALVGNICGYWIGARIGPALFRREDSRFFRKVYVERTHSFFEKCGARAIVLARFVPVVRTFITATAGVARMDFRKFVAFSALGALFWAVGVTLLGYWLGQVEFVSKNIELILILVVVISVVPLIIEFVRHRRQRGKA